MDTSYGPGSTNELEKDTASLLKILIATDCHLGYEETDPIIGDDSFVTFEEVLIKALDMEVDFILLGGDLFHHNNPSQKTMNKCMELLRQYTLGSQPVQIELISRAKDVFSHCIAQTANFLDENINVSIPVFSIHGNHDDPSGYGQCSSLDTLSAAGLMNYFGKVTDLDHIRVRPIILRKGHTYLALYGLSHIKDDRLCRLFLEKKVTFLEPEEKGGKCIRVLVLHQNRADRGSKRYISESFLPEIFDFVIWGHEHDCIIEPSVNIEKDIYIVQPGSTVATSLSEGEAKPKHIGLLNLWREYFKYHPIKLNTVRPFIWKSITIPELPICHNDLITIKVANIIKHCEQEVEKMICEAEKLLTGHPKQPKLPLIRLRCEYSEESELFNRVKFGQTFRDRVATPNGDIILFKKIRLYKNKSDSNNAETLKQLKELYDDNTEENFNFSECVNRIVNDYFKEHPESKMKVLNVTDMGCAVEKCIEKDVTDAIEQTVEKRLKNLIGKLSIQALEDESDIDKELMRIIEEEEVLERRGDKNMESGRTSTNRYEELGRVVLESEADTDENEPSLTNESPPSAKRKQRVSSEDSADNSEEDGKITFLSSNSRRNTVETKRGRGRGRGRGRTTKATGTTEKESQKSSTVPRSRQSKLKFAPHAIAYKDDSDSD